MELRLFTESIASKRSVLKQIAEKDAIQSLVMVLLIENIVYDEKQKLFIVEFSDGWYSFFMLVFEEKAAAVAAAASTATSIIDAMYSLPNSLLLLNLIKARKIYAGKKVIVTKIAAPPVLGLERLLTPN